MELHKPYLQTPLRRQNAIWWEPRLRVIFCSTIKVSGVVFLHLASGALDSSVSQRAFHSYKSLVLPQEFWWQVLRWGTCSAQVPGELDYHSALLSLQWTACSFEETGAVAGTGHLIYRGQWSPCLIALSSVWNPPQPAQCSFQMPLFHMLSL